MDLRDYRKYEQEEFKHFMNRSKGYQEANKFNEYGRRSAKELFGTTSLSDRSIDNSQFTNYRPAYTTRNIFNRQKKQKMVSQKDWCEN
jgi:hypothetical protein